MNDEHVKWGIDAVAGGVAVGTVANVLPQIAAIVSIIWFILRIWESKTVQDIVLKFVAWRSGKRD